MGVLNHPIFAAARRGGTYSSAPKPKKSPRQKALDDAAERGRQFQGKAIVSGRKHASRESAKAREAQAAGRDAAIASSEKMNRRSSLARLAGTPGPYQGRAGSMLLSDSGGGGATSAKDARQARMDDVMARSRQQHGGYDASVAQRMKESLAKGVDTRRMTFQAPGGPVRELRGEETRLADWARGGAAPAATGQQIAGLRADTARAFMGGAQAESELQARGMDHLQQMTRQMQLRGAAGVQPDSGQPNLSPGESAFVENRMAGRRVEAQPPKTVEGPGAEMTEDRARYVNALNQKATSMALTTDYGPVSQRIGDLISNWRGTPKQQKAVGEVQDDLERIFPEAGDREAYLAANNLFASPQSVSGFSTLSRTGREAALARAPEGEPSGSTTLQIPGYAEGVEFKTGEPMARGQGDYSAELDSQIKDAQARAQMSGGGGGGAAPTSGVGPDPEWAARRQAEDKRKQEIHDQIIEKGKQEIDVGVEPTAVDVERSKGVGDRINLPDAHRDYTESHEAWASRMESAAERTTSVLDNIKNRQARADAAQKILADREKIKTYEKYAGQVGWSEEELRKDHEAPFGFPFSTRAFSGRRKTDIPYHVPRGAKAAARLLKILKDASKGGKKQPATQPPGDKSPYPAVGPPEMVKASRADVARQRRKKIARYGHAGYPVLMK